MRNPSASLDLTLSDLVRSSSKSLRFGRLVFRKPDELGHMLLLTINRNHYGESKCVVRFDVALPSKIKFKNSHVSSLRISERISVLCYY